MKAEKELKCSNLHVITWEYEGEEVVDSRKIRFIPLWKWLLDFSTCAHNPWQEPVLN
jgi:predicted AAA+ superfamily ATPase